MARFSHAVQDSNTSLSVSDPSLCFEKNRRMSNKLPLPEAKERPRLDVIVLLLDMRSMASMQALQSSMEQLDSDFFFGRAALCVLNGFNPPTAALSGDLLTRLLVLASWRQPLACL